MGQNLNLSDIEYAIDESVKSSLENIVTLIGDNQGQKNNINNINNINNENNNIKNNIKNKNDNINKKEKEKIVNDIIIDDTNKQNSNEVIPEKSSKKKKKIKNKNKDEIISDSSSNKKDNNKDGVKIKVSNLTKIYEKNTKPVLNELSFKLRKSEIFALLGQNGEGKSTFVSILSGLKEAT